MTASLANYFLVLLFKSSSRKSNRYQLPNNRARSDQIHVTATGYAHKCRHGQVPTNLQLEDSRSRDSVAAKSRTLPRVPRQSPRPKVVLAQPPEGVVWCWRGGERILMSIRLLLKYSDFRVRQTRWWCMQPVSQRFRCKGIQRTKAEGLSSHCLAEYWEAEPVLSPVNRKLDRLARRLPSGTPHWESFRTQFNLKQPES